MNSPEHTSRIRRNPDLNRFHNRSLFPEQVAHAKAFLQKSGLPDIPKENDNSLLANNRSGSRIGASIAEFMHQRPLPPEPVTEWVNQFFSGALLDEFLDVVKAAPEAEVKEVLHLLIIQYQATQQEITASWQAFFQSAAKFPDYLFPVPHHTAKPAPERTGLTWVLNLIPFFPLEAIKGIDAYLLANRPALPTAYTSALSSCEAIIRTKFLSHWRPRQLFTELGVRDFELLVAYLYEKQGFHAHSSVHSAHRYADVQVAESEDSSRTVYIVQCKIRDNLVGITEAKQLLKEVQATNSAKGVLITTSHFSAEAVRFAAATQTIDLVDSEHLAGMLSTHLGDYWPRKVDSYISEQKSRYVHYM